MSPSLKSVAMAIYSVLHNVTSMHMTMLVYLPEDNISTTGCTDEVVLIDLQKLLLREVELSGDICNHPLPKNALR